MGLILPLPGSAQTEPDTVQSLPGVEIRTSVDRAEMFVGDLITYTLTITYDSTIELEPPPLGANLGAFDVKDYQPDVVTELDDGRIQSKSVFVLSTFTTGKYIIPPVPVVFTLPDGGKKILLSEAVPITVESLLQNVGDSADIKPLKAQYEFQRDYTPYYLWGGLGLLVLLIVAGLLWWRLRKRKKMAEPVDLRPAWEIAFERLAILKEKRLLREGNHKLYYIELSENLRWYLGRMYQKNVLDMTTGEYMAQFEEVALPHAVYDETLSFLRYADLVKFARLEPKLDRCQQDFDTVHAIVEQVRAEYERQRQPEPTSNLQNADEEPVAMGDK